MLHFSHWREMTSGKDSGKHSISNNSTTAHILIHAKKVCLSSWGYYLKPVVYSYTQAIMHHKRDTFVPISFKCLYGRKKIMKSANLSCRRGVWHGGVSSYSDCLTWSSNSRKHFGRGFTISNTGRLVEETVSCDTHMAIMCALTAQ